MKVKIQGFLGRNHSWSIVQQNIARALVKRGHDVHLCSTNGYELFPEDLRSFIKDKVDSKYDCQISYTAPHNIPIYLGHGRKNRFNIWCYEWPIIPSYMIKYYGYCDKVLPPSIFAKDCFINSKVPEGKIEVVPHGINLEDFQNKNKYPLKTKKKKIILVCIGQPHKRKAIPDIFKAYFEAFTKNDDVCLVAKISKSPIKQKFEIDPVAVYNTIRSKYKNPAEVELITDHVPNIVELYNASDIVYTLSHCEGYYLPGHEALAAHKLNIAPRYGGQLDFLNDNNSLLVEGSIVRAPGDYQYWESSLYNQHFQSNIQNAVLKLKQAVFEYDDLMKKFSPNIISTIKNYTWESTVQKIEGLCV